MGLRPGKTTRKLKRAYTRVSKVKPRKSFVVGVPYARIHIFEMGNKNKNYDIVMHLLSERSIQIRDNSLEAARIVGNKILEKRLGPENFFMKVLVFPHQILREHSLATGAGADRFSSGMSHSFGKPVGRAARIKRGQSIFMLKINKKDLMVARKAFKRITLKLPTPCSVKEEVISAL
jgi:large subunit ribosomal protein L10e